MDAVRDKPRAAESRPSVRRSSCGVPERARLTYRSTRVLNRQKVFNNLDSCQFSWRGGTLRK